ncbi:ubiquitin-associated protein 2-like isoform X4 [Mytilus californianus]|uniref:ubiquitin-associated protein 2-like isoform X4 n=1 Tax=Mytilus californianus TaxID=6549 RepID=UPI002247F9DD|nr:ubiquitin-associated protein 2-like isoform X4 [Mytilus californianus]
MSAAVASSRGNTRPMKEKHGKSTPQTQTKSEGPPQKVQATPEQIRLAQLTNDANSLDESAFRQKVKQVIDVTGITDQTEVEIALQDCGNDTERAINMLLEGNTVQGEWKEPGKKKKKPTPAPAKTEPTTNHVDEKTEEPEQTPEREKVPDKDRSENISRRGRRFDNRYDSRPPRLAARGRGRDRPNRENNDNDAGEFGGTFGQDKGFDSRGRGRGRGGRGGSRRGRGRSFNAQPPRERQPPKFDKGPQIDTWTNETAANAEKENATGPWGDGIEDWSEDTWQGNLTETKVFESSIQNREPEPMSDSSNTLGQRIDIGVLLQKTTNESPESYLTQYNQQATESIKNTIGIGSASRQSLSSQMGASSLTNHLSSGPLGGHQMVSSSLSNSMSVSSASSAAVDALVSSFTQNSNLNTAVDGGIDLTALTQNSSRANIDLTSLSQSRQNMPLDLNSLSQSRQSVPMSMNSQTDSISSSQQRPKPQRSKLPPPSKIPASAVEMPGHRNTNKVDVQFGSIGSMDASSMFGFGNGETVVSNLTSSANNSTQQSVLSNHLPKVSQQQNESVITSSMMTPPPSAGTSVISGQESPRNAMFHNSPYTTPTKKDSLSQNQVSSMSPPEPIPFPTSQTDRKSSPMMAPQRPGSTPGLSQNSLSTSNPESNLGSFSQGGYGTSPYQSQKSAMSNTAGMSGTAGLSNSSGLSNSAGLSNSSGLQSSSGLSNARGLSNSSDLTSATNRISNSAGLPNKSEYNSSSPQSSYQTQYQSGGNQYQSSQNQFQTGQNQFPAGQNQFHSGQSQYGSSQNQYQNYGQSGSTFQSQPGSFSGNQNHTASYQNNQNGPSSYPSTQSQTGSFSGSRGSSFTSGQSQPSSFPGSQNANSISGSQNPPGAYPGSQTTSESFNLTGNQNQGSAYNEMKSQGGSYSDPSSQRGSYNDRQTQSGSYSDRPSQSNSFSDRQSQSAGSYGSERTNQAGSYSDRQNQPSSYTGGSSFSSVTQAAQNYSANQSGQSSLYQAAVSNAYPGQSQSGSIYHQGGSPQVTSSYQPQVSTSYGRDSQSGSFSTNVSQSSSSYQRDGSSSGTQSSYTSQTFGGNAHQNSLQSNLQTSALSANKLGETLSKMTVKDTNIDSRQSPSQYENSSSSTTASLTSTTNSTSLISTVTTPSVSSSSAVTTTVHSTSAKVSSTTGTSKSSKAPPNLPPGVPLLSHQYIMGQNLPYFAGLQQPLYGYEDIQLLQQRLPPMNLQNLQNYNYDMTAFGNVPTTLNTGREQTSLAGNVPYSGTEKLNRVEAQSPIPSTQQQSTQSHQQHFINLPYGYCYPGTVLPGAPTAMGFQYPPQMFPVPPVTNTGAPHAGTTANAQFQKQTYGSHTYGSNKAYEDLAQVTDFTKSTYINQSQNKVTGVSGLLNGSATTVTADLAGTGLPGVSGYGKTHSQGFDKQGIHAGTPPPFNLQPFATGSQAGSHIGAPTNPYAAAQFIPLMTHQPPSQLHMQGLQQDTSTGSSARIHSQQTSSQAKTVTPKGYTNTYWGTS